MGQQLLWLQLVLEKTEPWRSLGELPAPQAQDRSTSNPAAPVGPSLPRGPGSPWGRKGNAPALFLASFWPWRSRLEVPGSDPGPPSVPHQPGKAVLGQSPERDGQEHRPPLTFAPSRPWGPGGPRRPVLPCLGVKKNPGLTSFSPARCSWSQTCPPPPSAIIPKGDRDTR